MELIEAQDWYERQVVGRGRRFREAINTLVGSDELIVIACFHASRDPSQWQRRM